MSVIRITTNFNIDLEFPAAPFHKRLFAWVLDIIFLIIYIFIAGQIISSMGGFYVDSTKSTAISLLLILPIVLYHLICEIVMNGQSVGKKIMGLRVISENGGRPAISQFVIRWLIRTSDYMVLIIVFYSAVEAQSGNLDYFWKIGIAFGLLLTDVILVNASKKQQRLGDMLAHTLLIQVTQKARIEDTVFLHTEDSYRVSFPEVMRLSDRDINALKSIRDTARKYHDYELADKTAEKIKAHLKIQTSMSPFDFLEICLKDYNYLATH
jgi:uncharacterized RDD family membrane protein YckC